MKKTTKSDIETVLWKACDSFRGKIDSSRYKDYVLSMLFVKYLSDVLLNVPSSVTHLIQEYHLSLYHTICLCVENELFA